MSKASSWAFHHPQLVLRSAVLPDLNAGLIWQHRANCQLQQSLLSCCTVKSSQSAERSHKNSVSICSKLMSVGIHGKALIRIHKSNQKLAVSTSQLGVRRFGWLGNKNYIQRLYWHACLLIIDRDQSYCIFIFSHFKWASRVIQMDVALTFL